MTVTTTLDRQYFDGDGSNKVFPFNFRFFTNDQIYVSLIAPDGTITPQSLTTNYTLTGALQAGGGTVTMIVAPPLTVPATRVFVQRILPQVQPTSIRNQGKFYPEIHEDAFDRLTMLIQQALAGLANALQLTFSKTGWNFLGYKGINVGTPTQPTDAATKDYVDSSSQGNNAYTDSQILRTVRGSAGENLTQLPPSESRSNKVMGFDASGQPIAILPVTGSGTEVAIDLANTVDPAKGAAMVGRSTVAADSILRLLSIPGKSDIIANVASYYGGWAATLIGPYGSNMFVWDATRPKSEHNGGSIHSPTVPWNGSQANHDNYLSGVGETSPGGTGCWVSLSENISIWQFGAVKFLNNGTNTTTDSTYAVQKAIYAAKKSSLTLTHSISKLATVLCNSGDVRISGQLVVPEGVVLDGVDKISGRICFGWSVTTKIVGYGRIYDQAQGNPIGTTFTKNWGLKNISLVPYYPETGPSSCTYVDYLFDIEPLLHNVRFILHKGAVSGGQLNAVGVGFRKCIDPDFQDVTFDGGLDHLYALDATYGWGVITARCRGIYSYNARGHGVLLGEGSNNNDIEISVQMPEQVGTNRAVYISGATPTGNVIRLKASGDMLKYGAIIEGTRNRVTGSTGGSVQGVDVRGSRNWADVILGDGVTWSDTGTYSEFKFSDVSKADGESKGVKRAISIAAVSTWLDVAEVSFTAGASHSAVVKASTTSEVAGIGRDCYDSTWLVGQNAAGVVATTEIAAPFNPAGSLKLRVVSTGTNKAALQVSIATGTGALTDVQFSMRSDQYAKIKAL